MSFLAAAYLTVFGPPALALLTARYNRSRWIAFDFAAGALLVATAFAYLAGFRFTSAAANAVWLLFSYFLYCLLSTSLLRLPSKTVRWMGFSVAAAPIVIACLVFLILPPFFRMMAATLYERATTPPSYTAIEGRFVCEVRIEGDPTAPSRMYSGNLFYPFQSVPILRLEAARLSFDQYSDAPATGSAAGSAIVLPKPAKPTNEKELCDSLLFLQYTLLGPPWT
jgi:hypothetical protein